MARAPDRHRKPRSARKRSALEQALALHQQGQLAGAERLYREALDDDALETGALLGLSLLLTRSARAEQAVALLEAALGELAQDDAPLLVSLSDAYRALGELQRARAALQRAVAAEALPEAFFRLGEVLEELGEWSEAVVCFTSAASLKPEELEPQLRLADALWRTGDRLRALGHYHAAVNAAPRSLPALLGLAQALRALQMFDATIAISARALAIEPHNARALVEKAYGLLAREQLGEAASCFRRATAAAPDHFSAHFGLMSAAFQTGCIEEAVAAGRRALAIRPDRKAHGNLVFLLAFHPDYDARMILDEARKWAAAWAEPLRASEPAPDHDLNPERRLRVGYVSGDFKDHCQALYMTPLLAAHDRGQVEVFCYSSVVRADAFTARLRQHADVWHDVATLDNAALAARIRADRIDVLVDLGMHMAGSRLAMLALDPAPVQVSWLAYPGTTGLRHTYRVTDRNIDPFPGGNEPASELPRIERNDLYSETSLVLPETFWCYHPLTRDPEVSPLPASGRGYVTFGCLGNLGKVNERVIALWSAVLRALPESRMLLRGPEGEPRTRLLSLFARGGIDAARVTFVPRQPRAAYLATYQGIDVCLDTFPYNGHTTSLDAHWMGVPVVTRAGMTVVSRAGACQARNLGLPFLIAEDDEAYVRAAVELAADLEKLAALRSGLRERLERSPLMDAARFARHLEHAYRAAWRAHCARAP